MTSLFKKTLLGLAVTSAFYAHAKPELNEGSTDNYLITYQQGAIPAQYQAKLVKHITTITTGTVALINLTAQEAKALSQISGVRVEQDAERNIIEPQSSEPFSANNGASDIGLKNYVSAEFEALDYQEITPYGIALTQADKVPEPDNNGIKVCVIDTGIQGNHSEFEQVNVSGNHSNYSHFWYNDASDHGTHVSGTIAANEDGKGVVGVVANGAIDVYVQKLQKTAYGENSIMRVSHILEAVEVCANQGANIINMSLGGTVPSETERDVFDRVADKGILIVAAAGNHGVEISDVADDYLYPASYQNVMSVASVDEQANLSGFSAVNDAVEIAAPGSRVLSTVDKESVNIDYFEFNGIDNLYYSTSFKQIDAGNTAYPRISQLNEQCLFAINFDTFADQYFTGEISAANKAELDAATQACKASEGEVLVTYFDVPADIPSWVSENTHNINYATEFPTLTVSTLAGRYMNANGMILTEYNQYGYGYKWGTSMATPHVSGVAAKVWSHFPQCSSTQIRDVLNYTATDLGNDGRDNQFGHGLINTKASYDYIAKNGCEIPASACPKAWYDNKAYLNGDQVTFNGEIFEANYWSKDALPTLHQGAYKEWHKVGVCAVGSDSTQS